jgi:DNA-binding transcriptional MerR regulator
MRSEPHSIGELAAASGCKVPTIRYYESRGLLPRPTRTTGNQRRYGADDLERLRFIRRGRELGFPLGTIRELLALTDDQARPCTEVDGIARTQIVAIDRRIRELESLRGQLQRMVEQCRHGTVADCRVLATLFEPPPPQASPS